MAKPLVSIVIVSYNTKELLLKCIESVEKYAKVSHEIIVSDNGSTDGSIEALKRKKVVLLENNANLGFSKGNNVARHVAQGEYILFLNPDTLFQKDVLERTTSYLADHSAVGAITCKVELPDGSLDRDTRRSFPTPFVALTHFSGLDRVFPTSPTFARYWYGFIPDTKEHEIDALQGAYFLAKKAVLDKVGWFDEDYFLDGEDIDLCWKIRAVGYKIVYSPETSITHIKKGSKSKNKSLKSVTGGVNAMETFYKKRLWSRYPLVLNLVVILGISLLRVIRTAKYYLS